MLKVNRGGRHGFTLVEMLVAVTILVLIMVLATQMIGATSKIWKNTSSKIEAFQGARDGFQLMTDELRQATLNTYWDYFNSQGLGRSDPGVSATSFVPIAYGRQSELHFMTGTGAAAGSLSPLQSAHTQGVFFQAPLDYTANPALYGKLQNVLNGTGFYIEFSNGTGLFPYANTAPAFLGVNLPYRSRLVQYIQPTEQLAVYTYKNVAGTTAAAWFQNPLINAALHGTSVRIVANNIIGLVIWPKASDSTTDASLTNNTYSYNSRLGLNSGVAASTATAPYSWSPSATPGASPQPLMMNQMPPIIHVAMIAIDEPSAKLLQGTGTAIPAKITAAYTQTGPGGTLFTNPLYMDQDLITFQTGPTGLASIKPRLNFRVFETTLSVKSARFSTQ